MIKGKFNITIGAQAGSESKGKLAAFLADKFKPDIISMASSPNAGHSVVMGTNKYVTYHLPVSWVAHRDAVIVLGPTSVINPPILMKEIDTLKVPPGNLMIHPRAVMIRPHYLHAEREEGLLKLGSTNQGVGIARREKLMRVDDITFADQVKELSMYLGDTVSHINSSLLLRRMVLHEMTQGFDLDLEHGIDRHYCTSKMVNPAMAMAEAGVPPQLIGDVYGVLRPYPIRVNNREGSSGPYAESREITWDDVSERSGYPGKLGELTTTTKLLRRVFEFSWDRIMKFSMVCNPTHLCLQFANYLNHSAFGKSQYRDLPREVTHFISQLQERVAPVAYVGTGPDHDDMIDRHIDEE